ncbi:multiple RNA-binding domain containing protein, putative [Entamoeba invadens IP1]|uniref:Multiple RNA-binding domain containing protein, putative n=1 Tax=Entamoeba invadens IP1 TaxID=370355 RepID=A0A0A1U2R8_ENTIV|nr:multiple RNA-binding domain containing protein, putative [Entamoeba invadens IP1]ELP88366.1 multiple RNA-binding domain containing protein, putative [Entamoeba invadens IP1]|eukprot:XP_004255137.1 multiple RNA-binding domain containing protein, putative [Entamoeba invadens IP1]
MSRIIVKGLPHVATEKTIKEAFQSFGNITDCKLVRTKEGVSREFAFLGFSTESEAQNAIEKMNNAYILSSKINVSIAKKIGDKSIERPWSKYSAGSSAHDKATTTEQPKKKEKKKVEEQPKKPSKSLEALKKLCERAPQIEVKKKKARDTVDDENKETKKTEPVKMEEETTSQSSEEERKDEGEEDNQKEKKAEVQSEEDEIQVPENENWEEGRILVNNLPYACSEQDVREAFEKFGEITEVHLPIDKVSGKTKGFAFVMYVVPQDAVKAFNEMDGQVIKGRIIHVNYAKADPYAQTTEEKEAKTYKDKKANELKKRASNQFNWATLYMRPDTAITAVAEQLGMAKEKFLDVNSSNLAVRAALAETFVINETKKYLGDRGVNCTVLENGLNEKRGNTAIIVKNIAANADQGEIKTMFENCGKLKRFLMPKSKALAIAEFIQPNDAKTAFKRIVYSRYKGVPLYLEWAPERLFNEEAKSTEEEVPKKVEKKESPKEGGELELVEEGTHTLYIKNVNPKTTEDTLRKVFTQYGQIHSVSISKNPTSSKNVFCFLEFARHSSALNAMKNAQGQLVDGNAIAIELSIPKKDDFTHAKRKKAEDVTASTKLLVKNLPFETNLNEVRELFRVYGTLRGVRVPKKIDGQLKGYAFIEYATKQEAANAKAAMANSHLYGRHLVIEFAKETELD